MPMKKQCLICNKLFLVKKCHYEKRFCCSKLCQSESFKTKLLGDKNPNFKNTLYKKCLICSNVYKSYSKIRKYCSNKCVAIHNKNRPRSKKKIKNNTNIKVGVVFLDTKKVRINKKYFCKKCPNEVKRKTKYCKECRKSFKHVVNCVICNKEFTKLRCARKASCSKDCLQRLRSKQYSGSSNPNYKDGRKPLTSRIRESLKNNNLIKQTLIRDKFTCNICKQVGGSLEVDHIKKFSIIFDEFTAFYGLPII